MPCPTVTVGLVTVPVTEPYNLPMFVYLYTEPTLYVPIVASRSGAPMYAVQSTGHSTVLVPNF